MMAATTIELSRRIERAAAEYLLTRYTGPGNPMGTEVLRSGDAVATKVPFVPTNDLMNSVHGLEEPERLPDVLAFYAATEQPCSVHVPPYAPIALTDALARGGFRIERYAAVMVAEPVPQTRLNGIVVDEVARAELDVFLDTINIGFDSPATVLPVLRRNQSFWCDVPQWHLFLARVDGAPAGAAVLSVHDDIGYLAAGSVLPQFRGRGIHAALLGARIAKAKARQCKIVTGAAAWGSQSQRNQQRARLAIAHVKSVWSNRPAPVE
jgi:GNAT superfamily N-acetyltransferase